MTSVATALGHSLGRHAAACKTPNLKPCREGGSALMAAVRGRRDRDLEARLRAYFGPDITRAHLKMAEAPMGATQRMLHPNFFVTGTL